MFIRYKCVAASIGNFIITVIISAMRREVKQGLVPPVVACYDYTSFHLIKFVFLLIIFLLWRN